MTILKFDRIVQELLKDLQKRRKILDNTESKDSFSKAVELVTKRDFRVLHRNGYDFIVLSEEEAQKILKLSDYFFTEEIDSYFVIKRSII